MFDKINLENIVELNKNILLNKMDKLNIIDNETGNTKISLKFIKINNEYVEMDESILVNSDKLNDHVKKCMKYLEKHETKLFMMRHLEKLIDKNGHLNYEEISKIKNNKLFDLDKYFVMVNNFTPLILNNDHHHHNNNNNNNK